MHGSHLKSRWLVVLFGLVGVIFGGAGAIGAEQDTSAANKIDVLPLNRPWRALETPNFLIIGNVPDKRLEDSGGSMERLLGALEKLPPVPRKAPVPTTVFVFRGSESFDRFDLIYDGKPRETAGYFVPRPHHNFIAISSRDFDSSREIVQHELVHYFVRINMPDIPLWLNEGLAELYSNFLAQGKWLSIGRIHQNHLYWLDRNAMLPLPELFAIDHSSPVYNETERRGVFYSQSWLLVHYLLLGADEGQRQLLRFLELNGQVPFEQAFAQAFERSPEQLLKELGMYMRSERFVYRRVEIGRKDRLKESFRFREISEAEVYARLGELLAVQRRDAEAEAYLAAALAKNPNEPRAHVAKGVQALFPKEKVPSFDEALGHLATAKAYLEGDPTIDYLIALARSQRGDPPKFLRPALAKLVNARPQWPDAWELLAWAWEPVTDDLEQKSNVFLGALKMMPDRADYAQILLSTYRSAGRNAEADALIERYFKIRGLDYQDAAAAESGPLKIAAPGLTGPRVSESQREARLESASLKTEAEALVEQGRFQEAVEIYERVLALQPSSPVSRARLEELRQAAAEQLFINGYNRAVKLFNERRWLDTIQILEKLVGTTENAERNAKAEKLLSQAREQRRLRGDSG